MEKSKIKKNIVLNIPHSSINGIFDKNTGNWVLNPFFINDVVRKHTDWYTDVLFTVKDMEGIKPVVFPYSRFVCDVERLENDPLEEIGQGIIYTHFNGYKRNELSKDIKSDLLYYRDIHIQFLETSLKEGDVLIDCHSFTPDEDCRTDICIGYNDDWSYNEKLVDTVISTFKKHGFVVTENEPYSNSINPEFEFDYSSIMIEVNKRLYLDERTLMLNTEPKFWMRWYGCLTEVYNEIRNLED